MNIDDEDIDTGCESESDEGDCQSCSGTGYDPLDGGQCEDCYGTGDAGEAD